jgi:hypothetical protein
LLELGYDTVSDFGPVASPLLRGFRLGEPSPSLALLCSPSPAPPVSPPPLRARCAMRHRDLCARAALVPRGPGCATGPRPVDPVHEFFNSRINLKIGYFRNFAKRLLDFLEIDPQSIVSQSGPKNLENNSRGVPSLRKIHKIAPETSKLHIFSTTTPNPVILVPKFSESLSPSFCTFIKHMFVAFC